MYPRPIRCPHLLVFLRDIYRDGFFFCSFFFFASASLSFGLLSLAEPCLLTLFRKASVDDILAPVFSPDSFKGGSSFSC